MKKLRFLIMLAFVSVSMKTYSQKGKDTVDIVMNAKIFFLSQDTSFFTATQINHVLNDSRNYEILPNKGFYNEIIFIELKFRGDFGSLRNKKITDSAYIQNKVPFSCDYIMAYKWKENRFYRLKGFTSNDFILLFNEKYRSKDKLTFLNRFWINDLDISCLFDSFFGKQKGNDKLACVQSCSLSDPKFLKVRTD